jgi:hypothetical protein
MIEYLQYYMCCWPIWGGGGENRPHSAGNWPGHDGGSAAHSVSDFLQ